MKERRKLMSGGSTKADLHLVAYAIFHIYAQIIKSIWNRLA